jgi:hypothetical protein
MTTTETKIEGAENVPLVKPAQEDRVKKIYREILKSFRGMIEEVGIIRESAAKLRDAGHDVEAIERSTDKLKAFQLRTH